MLPLTVSLGIGDATVTDVARRTDAVTSPACGRRVRPLAERRRASS